MAHSLNEFMLLNVSLPVQRCKFRSIFIPERSLLDLFPIYMNHKSANHHQFQKIQFNTTKLDGNSLDVSSIKVQDTEIEEAQLGQQQEYNNICQELA